MQTNGPRNRALLFGTVWTLATAAALAWFKSHSFEPITMMTLATVALGWAGVLSHALGAEQRTASAAAAAASHENCAVIEELAQAIGMQMQRAGIELGRVDDLLAHAIEQLMSAFNSVSEQAQRHQSELAQAASAALGTPAAEQLRAAAECVASEVNGAVTALQFRDVVGQKLGHVRLELEALEQAMRQIRCVSGTSAGPAAPSGQADLAARVQDLLRRLRQAQATSPVQQELMHAGEVELF